MRAPGIYLPGDSTLGIAAIGTTAKKVNGGIGNDFGSILLYPGQLVTPATPIGGPVEIYDQGLPAPVSYYGHGYVFEVAQGKPGGGGSFFPDTNFSPGPGRRCPVTRAPVSWSARSPRAT